MFDTAAYLFHPLHGLGYQFWSGIGSDIGEVTILGGIIAMWRHINCEEPGCWRTGHRHPGHGRPVCRDHYHSEAADPRHNAPDGFEGMQTFNVSGEARDAGDV